MEKFASTYDLKTIKQVFSQAENLRMTATALRDARSMGFSMEDVVDAIQQLRSKDLVKSMTTYHNHRVWQDVYNTEFNGFVIYIKFQLDEDGHFLVSFKEK